LLTWWLSAHDVLLAHGAAVGDADGAVVLTAPGGSGKSTTSLACVAGGMGFLGDDYVALEPALARVWSVYGSAKLAPDHLQRFPGLLEPEPARPSDPVDAKRVGWPLREHPERTVVQAPVRALVVPAVVGGPDCRLVPLPASRALMAIAPLTMFQTPGDQRAAFALSSRVVRGVPTWRLELGRDMTQAPVVLRALLDGVAS
jgi:hypothetical protein